MGPLTDLSGRLRRLDRRRAGVVLPAISFAVALGNYSAAAPAMAFLGGVVALFAAGGIVAVAAAAGIQLLDSLRIAFSRPSERLLLGAALGSIVLEVGFFLAQVFPHPRVSCVVVILLLAALGSRRSIELYRIAKGCLRAIWQSRWERAIAALVFLVLAWQGMAATAPLTGSDALHYHFAVPRDILINGFYPNFSITHSFLIGEGHALIFGGLLLGSDRLALALLFVGGVLAAAAGACIARQWVSRFVAWLVALTFLLTPVVFWQLTSAGSPDLWMAFFAAAATLLLAQAAWTSAARFAAACGGVGGALAGAKYTGCILAAVLLLIFWRESRSARRTVWFFSGALATGIWPYARNYLWTGDPVFPMALRWLHPAAVNDFALQALRSDTGASGSRNLWHLAKFPFFAAIDPLHLGFWQFFGPLCLMLLPLFLLLARRNVAWRVMTFFLIFGSLGIGLSSHMLRFLLPLAPLAAAAAFAGAAAFWELTGRASRFVLVISVAGFLLLCAGGMVVYTRPAISASLGRISREAYLQQSAPDYELSAFVNHALGDRPQTEAGQDQRLLLFFRHLYYVRVPFVYGEPTGSWAVDPAKLRDPQDWRRFFQEQRIAWVLRTPDYPQAIAPGLLQLEAQGGLVPIAEREVSDFDGNRSAGVRRRFRAVLLEVRPK